MWYHIHMKKSHPLFKPQLHKYHVCKEVKAVSLPDALKKEKNISPIQIYEINEEYDSYDDD